MVIAGSPPRKSFWIATLTNSNFLETLLAPAIRAAGYRLVRLRLMGGKRKILQVMAERPDGGMEVGDCAELSRKLSEVLEAADPISDEYVLEVSSPGIDRPLTEAADFERFAGHEARIEMLHPVDGRRRFKGNIVGLGNETVIMETGGDDGPQTIALPLPGIAEAKLVLTDRLIRDSLKARDERESKRSGRENPGLHRRN